jgi:hypothetical protein
MASYQSREQGGKLREGSAKDAKSDQAPKVRRREGLG